MIKNYILDTNVLLQNPNALFAFEDNNVIIPEIVIEELDNFKKGHLEKNVNAREIARRLNELKESSDKSLFEGIKLDNGGMIYIKNPICHENSKIPNGWDDKKHDNDILNTCLNLMEDNNEIILVTQDIYLGIKADYLNIKNENFKNDAVKDIDEQYSGIIDLCADADVFDKFAAEKSIMLNEVYQIQCNDKGYTKNYKFERYPNEFVILHNADNYEKSTLLGRINKSKKFLNALVHQNERPFDVKARNVSQIFIQEALMDSVKDTPLVLIKGPAGTAKTFYAVAVALERLYNQNNPDNFRKMLVCRPNQLMEDDIGYLPGTEKEKIEPLMRPIFDSIMNLIDNNDTERELQDKITEILSRNFIDMQSIGYLRGRSIERHILIVDECFVGSTGILSKDNMIYPLAKLYDLYIHNKSLPEVVSYNEITHNIEYKKILNVVQKGERKVVRLCFANRTIICTENHPLLTFDGWKQAKDFDIGDCVLSTNSEKFQNVETLVLKSKIYLEIPQLVYDMEVEDNHNFIVIGTMSSNSQPEKYYHFNYSGIIAHNCQNISPNTAKSIITRAGQGTKVIVCGDPEQIDNQYLDSKTNGISYLVEKMKASPLCAIVTTSEKDVVRSNLAKEAVKYLCN